MSGEEREIGISGRAFHSLSRARREGEVDSEAVTRAAGSCLCEATKVMDAETDERLFP